MNCPECGVEMTRHATKILQPTSAAEEAMVDPDLGGVVVERHACSACGEGASRRIEPGAK
ncbi:MAG TPA: hypothetical protein VLK65_14320 [Vicinamibacteria bacterium]|nr:hypothetical protein [Vicinamibacteria bacterium]